MRNGIHTHVKELNALTRGAATPAAIRTTDRHRTRQVYRPTCTIINNQASAPKERVRTLRRGLHSPRPYTRHTSRACPANKMFFGGRQGCFCCTAAAATAYYHWLPSDESELQPWLYQLSYKNSVELKRGSHPDPYP